MDSWVRKLASRSPGGLNSWPGDAVPAAPLKLAVLPKATTIIVDGANVVCSFTEAFHAERDECEYSARRVCRLGPHGPLKTKRVRIERRVPGELVELDKNDWRLTEKALRETLDYFGGGMWARDEELLRRSTKVIIVLPRAWKRRLAPSPYLGALAVEGQLVYAPPGRDADDEYVLDLADRTGGHIVFNDLFKDFQVVRQWVAHHTLRYALEGRNFVAKRDDLQRLKLYVRSALWEPPRNRDDSSRPLTLRVLEELGPGLAWKTESHQEAIEPLRVVCLFQSAGAYPGQFFEVKTLTHHFVLCKEGPPSLEEIRKTTRSPSCPAGRRTPVWARSRPSWAAGGSTRSTFN